MLKWFAVIILVLGFFLTINSVGDDCRPTYNIPDDVFKELPEFPCDFHEIKSLYESGKLLASQLGEEYYQPEMIPLWNYWSNETYANTNLSHFGRYGLSFYPSFLKYTNVVQGDIINVSVLVRADWGIQIYQGLGLNIKYPENIIVEVAEPIDNDIILSPTYPYFFRGWMQPILLHIHVLETGNYSIKINEQQPSILNNEKWKEQYGKAYCSSSSLFVSGTPKLRVDIRQPEPVKQNVEPEKLNAWATGIICISILLLSYLFFYAYKKRAKRKEEKEI